MCAVVGAETAPEIMWPSLCFCNLNFFQVKVAGFCKNWGVSACVNVVLQSIGRIGHHITRVENGGKFGKQSFDIIRHRVWDGLNEGGGLSNRQNRMVES